jgi:uncharacterized membrane protein
MNKALWWPLVIVVSALAAGTLTFLQAVTPLRAAVGFWFLLVCPGMAYVRLLRVKAVYFQWVLAIALSIAIDTIVAQALLVTGNWSSRVALIVVIVVSMMGAAMQMVFANPGQTKES